MMDPGNWWGHGFGFMWIIPIIFLIIILFFMRGLFIQGSGGRGSGSKSESAREILDKRFAKGEINKEEYEQMKKSLNE